VSGRAKPRPIGRVWIEDVNANNFWIYNLERIVADITLEGNVTIDGHLDMSSSAGNVHNISNANNILPYVAGGGNVGSGPLPFGNVYARYLYSQRDVIVGPDYAFRQYYLRADDHIYWKSHDGTTEHVVADALNGVLSVPRAGDITFANDTKSLNWSDTNLYRDGVNVLKTDDNLEAFTLTTDQYIYLGADVTLYRSAANVLKTDDNFEAAGYIDGVGGFKVGAVAGVDDTFNNADGDTVTVVGGIITDIS